MIVYPFSVGIKVSFIADAIKDSKIYSERIIFKIDNKSTLFLSSSGQIGEVDTEINPDEMCRNENINSSFTDCEETYSIEFLKIFSTLAPATEKVYVSFKKGEALKLEFNFKMGGNARVFLKPVKNYDENEDEEDIEQELVDLHDEHFLETFKDTTSVEQNTQARAPSRTARKQIETENFLGEFKDDRKLQYKTDQMRFTPSGNVLVSGINNKIASVAKKETFSKIGNFTKGDEAK